MMYRNTTHPARTVVLAASIIGGVLTATAACTGAIPATTGVHVEPSSSTSAAPQHALWLDDIARQLHALDRPIPQRPPEPPYPDTPDPNAAAPTSTGSGSTGAPGAGLSPDDARANAEAAALRDIDVCAMHNPAAAAAATKGDTPDSLMPTSGLDGCRLTLTEKDKTYITTYTLRINSTLLSPYQQGMTPTVIGGVRFLKDDPLPQLDLGDCRYVLPRGATHGLALDVEPPPDDQRTHRPSTCDVATAYLTATIGAWRTPPTRNAHLTTPTLTLAAADPCAAADAVSATVKAQLQPLLATPYTCRLAPTGDSGHAITISYGFGDRPAATGRTDRQLTIAGVRAVQSDDRGAGLGCRITIQADAKIAIRADQTLPNDTGQVELASVTAPTCDQAVAVAAVVIPTLPQ